MLQRFRNVFKNQKGLTLIELLAVVVILGIISAIAVPSIGGIIDNTKKDAHIANAKEMINAAKMAVTSDKNLQPKDTPVYLSLKYLEDEGYLEQMEDPDGGSYRPGTYTSTINGKDSDNSVVEITKDSNGSFSYEVKLSNGDRGITTFTPLNDLDRKYIQKASNN